MWVIVKTSKKSVQLRKKASMIRCLTHSGSSSPPSLLRSANGSRGPCARMFSSLLPLASPPTHSSHSWFLLQSFVVSIPFPLYLCKILLFFPAPNFFFSLSLFPLIGKGGGQEAFCGRTCEPAPVLSAFTWIPHWISLSPLNLPFI